MAPPRPAPGISTRHPAAGPGHALPPRRHRESPRRYVATPASKIPAGFDAVCKAQDWDTSTTWTRLNAGKTWYSAPNEAYIYHNSLDGLWWIDSPDGNGAYKGPGPAHAPPAHGYQDLGEWPAPTVLSYRG